MKTITEEDLQSRKFCVYRDKVWEVKITQIAVVLQPVGPVQSFALCLDRDKLFDTREEAAKALI